MTWMDFFWFTTFTHVKYFCWILNLNYQNFLYEFWRSHDSLCLKMGVAASSSETCLQNYTTSYSKNQSCILQFFCPTFTSHISMLQLVTTSAPRWPDSYPVCSLTHTFCWTETWTVRFLKHVKSVDKAEGRTATTNSRNSKPSAPSICKFQAVHRSEGNVTSCLFICGLLNCALDSLECVMLIGLVVKVVTFHVIVEGE
jgi:hypothetical protein